MIISFDYREQAERCRQLAREATGRETREEMLVLADRWIKLAEQSEEEARKRHHRLQLKIARDAERGQQLPAENTAQM